MVKNPDGAPADIVGGEHIAIKKRLLYGHFDVLLFTYTYKAVSSPPQSLSGAQLLHTSRGWILG